MHAAAAAVRTARRPPEKFGDELPGRHPLGQRMTMSAVRAEHHIALPQVSTHADGNRLFADIRVAGPVNKPLLVRPGKLLFALPDHLHIAVQFEQRLFVDIRG